MARNTKKNNTQGHPAKKDPVVAKLAKIQETLVPLTRELERRLTAEQSVRLKGAIFGIMDTYAIISGSTRPDSITNMNYDEFMEDREGERKEFEEWREEQEAEADRIDNLPTPTSIIEAAEKMGAQLTKAAEQKRLFLEEAMKRHPAGKSKLKGLRPNLVVVDEISDWKDDIDLGKDIQKAMKKELTKITTCGRCFHMSFNHAWADGKHQACSFTNCNCPEFIMKGM